MSVAPASRPRRNPSRNQIRAARSSVERPPRPPSNGSPAEPTRTAAATAPVDEQAWARAMRQLRHITLVLSTALAAVIARIVIDGPKPLFDLTGALMLLLLACSVALRRHGRRLSRGASPPSRSASSGAERVDVR